MIDSGCILNYYDDTVMHVLPIC